MILSPFNRQNSLSTDNLVTYLKSYNWIFGVASVHVTRSFSLNLCTVLLKEFGLDASGSHL
jgi:hypothetical protein